MTQAELDADALAKATRAERVKRVLITGTAFTTAAILVLLLVLISQVRATQQTGSPVLRAIQGQQTDIKRAADAASETNDQILDCLDPEGECYQRSQENTGGVVASINEITQYAAVCADRPGTQSLVDIRRCVADLIAAAEPEPES